MRKELELIPIISEAFEAQIKDFNDVEFAKRQAGILPNQDAFITSSRIMGDARDIVLDDLQLVGNGVLFNEVALENLTDEQVDALIVQLKDLERGYVDETSEHYNPDVAAFLSLYGYGSNMPGRTLSNLIEELKR